MLTDALRRYFMCNPAPIFQIKRVPSIGRKFTPCSCGNAGGFFWRSWRVIWRKPYAKCWTFNPSSRRWEIAHAD